MLLLFAPSRCILGQNLVVNGSMTSIKGADVVAPGWVKSYIDPRNTPDINDTAGPLLSTPGLNWSNGHPVESPDGGTWQNTFTGEGVMQTIDGITPGVVYYFRYYYTSQGITQFDQGSGTPNIAIHGATGYINPDYGGPLFQWNTYCGALTADSTSIVIIASGPLDAYMAYDGFYLSTAPLSSNPVTQQPADTSVCNGSAASFDVQYPGSTGFFWEVNSGSGWTYLKDTGYYSGSYSANLRIDKTDTGMNSYQYRCYIKDATCPLYSDPATLTVWPLPDPVLFANVSPAEICGGNTLTIRTDKSYKSYLWSDNSNGSSLTVNQPGAYWMEVTDANGCSGKDSITVSPCAQIFIPDAFTPNNDGRNDIFKPVITGSVVQYNFSIYNQWGQLVFQTADTTKGWHGYANGRLQQNGVFVWVCSIQFSGEPLQNKKGTVILLR
ncbi:MAG TPA: gliding motility-associated C-terminal domain-containing protein [Chitinophagaceae bacterium]|nr:gliding motility-associated C-terminal domain-containing protein [Chitinophagaceae bacterium]